MTPAQYIEWLELELKLTKESLNSIGYYTSEEAMERDTARREGNIDALEEVLAQAKKMIDCTHK